MNDTNWCNDWLHELIEEVEEYKGNVVKLSKYLEKKWWKTHATDELEEILSFELWLKAQNKTKPLIDEIRNEVLWKINLLLNTIDKQDKVIWLLSTQIDKEKDESKKILDSYNQAKFEIEKLDEEASTDALTGLKNVRWLQKEINRLITKYQNNKLLTWVSVSILDIDDFKKINDQFWHWNWDNILKNLALLLQNYFWNEDFSIFRKWGEEFVIISEIDNKVFINRLHSFFEKLKHNEIKRDNKNKISVSFSWATIYTKSLGLWEKKSVTWNIPNKKEIYETIVQTLWQWLIEAKAIPWKGQIVEK